ncbi:fumarylacetoacetate hydrolase family protein [Nocardiopsis sp. HNM0947]|uniref:Fumarylacetoacetate hydrolase family protein n=1 Tax=Nocardiopsis coralli TaxID=2772213 RepID=A0ABR9NZW8_9ACTN|nr:2-keto-4-pentenoate hydratase [Nocardiopsis coralli]MBE2997103.1 fumarylacetoacetate hydrolase family protein [Nocardiopsis coralli]
MLEPDEREAAADLLWAAERDRAPVAPLRSTHPGIDAADAYTIQLHNIARRTAAGARVVGHKVGLSSPVMQQMMGVDEPDYGHLLDTMALDAGRPVQADAYCSPRIEVEIAYVLGSALPGAGCTEQDVLEATAYVVPALELIDSRIRDWDIGIADTIADNASSAGMVLGTDRARPGGLDPAAIDAALFHDGTRVAEGSTGAVLGDPTRAVAWLARTVAGFGVKLEAGHVILPGSCTRAVDVRPGGTFSAEFAGLGSVTVRFE